MNSFWQELIKFLGGFAILATALAWLAKSIITHYLSKDIESYKNQIAFESAREVEHFKAQLQIAAKEHDVRFSKLHEKRAEAISELYVLLRKANDANELFDFVLMIGSHQKTLRFSAEVASSSRNKIAEETADECIKLSNFFTKHKLFFSEELADQMDKLISAIVEPSSNYRIYQQLGIGEPDEICKGITEAWNEERPNIQQIFKIIEKELRTILGSDMESNVSLQTGNNSTKALKE